MVGNLAIPKANLSTKKMTLASAVKVEVTYRKKEKEKGVKRVKAIAKARAANLGEREPPSRTSSS